MSRVTTTTNVSDGGGGSSQTINDDTIKDALAMWASSPEMKADIDAAIKNSESYQQLVNDVNTIMSSQPASSNSTSSNSKYSSNGVEVSVGDKVQIKAGGLDVTNGITAKSGVMYGEGGPLTAEVVLIDTNWSTGGNFGLPQKVVKVRCSNEGVVVWQVRPEDIVVVVKSSKPETVQTSPSTTTTPPKTSSPNTNTTVDTYQVPSVSSVATPPNSSQYPYAIRKDSLEWTPDYKDPNDSKRTIYQPSTRTVMSGSRPETNRVTTKTGSKSGGSMGSPVLQKKKSPTGGWRQLNEKEKKSIGRPDGLLIDETAISGTEFSTVFDDTDKRSVLLNNNKSDIQNEFNFPYQESYGKANNTTDGPQLETAKYDYKILIGDKRIKQPKTSLKDQLTQIRATFGIPTHGRESVARAMKYYMYNRFRTPDSNLRQNKTFTHIFFTRPDLYLLDTGTPPTVARQIQEHTEGSMMWHRHPELFKLLTDCSRCGDSNNFNFLLSQQVLDFDIKDEELSTFDAGKSWRNFSMVYGDVYTGRESGQFTCSFQETSNLAVFNLIRMWITYIDNVARGAWSPCYDLTHKTEIGVSTDSFNDSYVYTKTLDYASSVYVFTCGPDGEDVLYWTKYYGVFPISTGASALSVTEGKPPGDPIKPSITFRYSYKRDMSPISLIEFNSVANVDEVNAREIESPYHTEFGHSVRPYVGVPFIEMDLNGSPRLQANTVKRDEKKTQIRLKFRRLRNEDIGLDKNIDADGIMFASPE